MNNKGAQVACCEIIKHRFYVVKRYPVFTAKVTIGDEEYTKEYPESFAFTDEFIKPIAQNGSYLCLHDAVIAQDFVDVEKKLSENVDPNALDNYGDTPAKYAAAFGRNSFLVSLLFKGANLKIEGKDGLSAWDLLDNSMKNHFKELQRQKAENERRIKEFEEKKALTKELQEIREEIARLKRERRDSDEDNGKRQALEKKV